MDQTAISQQHGFRLWLAAGAANEGYAQIELGNLTGGLRRLNDGVRQWHQAVPGLVKSHWCALLADANRRSALNATNEVDRARAIAQANEHVRVGLGWAAQSGECYFVSELHRVQGTLAEDRDDLDMAQHHFNKARNYADSQGAHLFALRAAVAVGRVLERRKEFTEIAALVEVAIGRVLEGHTCPDLTEAEELLERVRRS